MLPAQALESYLISIQPRLVDIVLELRNLVAEVNPGAVEVLHRYGLTYYDAEKGGPVSGGICQIQFMEDHIRLGFIHGAFLPDPAHLLEGDRIAKRFIRIYHYEDAPWEVLKEYIRASDRFDPYSLKSQGG
jgi:hypothetical protein